MDTYSYAPWQLQEVRRQLRMNAGDLDEALGRAAKMSGLALLVVQKLATDDKICVAILSGKEEEVEPQQEVQDYPAPPEGNA